MGKFDHLDRERLSAGRTAEYHFTRAYSDVVPVLTVRPIAPTLNPAYTNAFVRASGGARRIQAMQHRRLAATDFAGMSDESRNIDRDLYAEHVVVGWRDVVGADGKDVDFCKKDCREFLHHIDDYVFDELRAFCLEPGNFVDVLSDDDAQEVGNG